MKSLFVRFVREEAGQDLIEYTLIATLVSLVASLAPRRSAQSLNDWYNTMWRRSTTWSPGSVTRAGRRRA